MTADKTEFDGIAQGYNNERMEEIFGSGKRANLRYTYFSPGGIPCSPRLNMPLRGCPWEPNSMRRQRNNLVLEQV
jgi:hypothetical protein